MLVDSGKGAEAESTSNFFVGGRVAILLYELREEVEDFFLPPSDCHSEILANLKRKSQEKSSVNLCFWKLI